MYILNNVWHVALSWAPTGMLQQQIPRLAATHPGRTQELGLPLKDALFPGTT